MELRDSSCDRVAHGRKLALSARGSRRLGLALLLVLSACGAENKRPFNEHPSAGGSAGSSTGGAGAGGTPVVGSGGASSGGASGGVQAVGAGGASASSGGNAGISGSTSASGGTSAGGSGSKSSGGSASGGRATAAGGSASGGSASGGTGGGVVGGCTRELLKSTVDAYFKALAAHDPTTLPLADNVKFTENGKAIKLDSQAGLWKGAGTLKYAHTAFDTETCGSASEAVVPEGSTDLPFALRLKLLNQKITEIETIAVRTGDYKVSGSNFASNPAAIISSNTTVKWEDPVPAGQRNTRAELIAWMDKYFKVFPRGVCDTTSDCKRLENGGGNFSCSAGASCASGSPTGQPAVVSHVLMADVETGISVGFDMFMGNIDMHMAKMYGGKIYAVHAILGAATSSGWD